MSPVGIVILGAIAGFTIYLGLPPARVGNLSISTRAFLNATAASSRRWPASRASPDGAS